MDNQLEEVKRQLKTLLERSGKKILAIVPDPPQEFLQSLDEEAFNKLLGASLSEHNRRIRVHNSGALASRGGIQIEKRTVYKGY